jgi:hypothetical protein
VESEQTWWGREEELPGQLSTHLDNQARKDSSQQADCSNTKSEVGLGVAEEAGREPEQRQAACRGWDRDRPGPDTSTMRHPRSTTSRADARASRGTSARYAKRRYRAHDRCRRATRV